MSCGLCVDFGEPDQSFCFETPIDRNVALHGHFIKSTMLKEPSEPNYGPRLAAGWAFIQGFGLEYSALRI